MHDALIYFTGPAGSGKSTLVAAFHRWLTLNGFNSTVVNLDPGALTLPYEPDIDIRQKINLTRVMEEHGLGPNGAQVVCADLLALQLEWLTDQLNEQQTQYILVDTPGQLELFLFREASAAIVANLSDRSMLAMLYDPLLSRSPNGFVTQMLLTTTAAVRFPLPQVALLSKVDLLEPAQRERIEAWSADLDALWLDVSEQAGAFEGTLSLEMLKAMQTLSVHTPLVPVSAFLDQSQGMEDLYSSIQNIYGAAEDLTV